MIEPVELSGQELVRYINDLNAKVLRGEQVTDDEIRSAVLALRTKRKFDAEGSGAAKKQREAADIPSTDDLAALFDEKPAAKKPAPKKIRPSSLDLDSLFSTE